MSSCEIFGNSTHPISQALYRHKLLDIANHIGYMPVRAIGLSGPVKRTGPPLRTNAVSPGGPQTGVRCVRDRTPLNRPAPSRFEEEGAGGLRESRDLPTKAAKAAAA